MARKIYGKITVVGSTPLDTKLRVIAWDADKDEDDHMGTTSVAVDGSYSIEYAGVDWDWSPTKLFPNWRPDIYIVVEWFNESTKFWQQVAKSKVYSDQDVREDREINLSVTLPRTNTSAIYGWVTNEAGIPLEGFTVTAWDEKPSMRGLITSPDVQESGDQEFADFLGSAVTDKNGHYRVNYASSRFELTLDRLMREGIEAYRRPDIFIKVHRKGESGIIYRSPTHQNIIIITGCRIDAKIDESRV